MLITNPFPSDIEVDDHHVLNNFHAIDAEGAWNKWFVIPIPTVTHKTANGNASYLKHWRYNERWIKKIYDIDINDMLGNRNLSTTAIYLDVVAKDIKDDFKKVVW